MHEPQSLSRRTMLQLLAAGGTGLAAAACTNTSNSGSGGGGGGGGGNSPSPSASAAGSFQISDSGAKLPSGKVKLSWMDSGDVKAFFFQDLAKAYHKKHPNITIDYNGSNWNNITQVVTVGVRNGSAPDVFQTPPQIPTNVAVANGWFGAFDDIVPNFAEVKKRFPVGLFADGVTDFNGKTYAMPMTTQLRVNNLLLFNRDYTKQADLDLDNEIITWDQLRQYAKKLTKQGGGQYYGLIFGLAQPNTMNGPAGDMAMMAGLAADFGSSDSSSVNYGMSWKTGKYSYTDPIIEEIIETFMAMRDDGSIHPDSVSLDAPGARERMPEGQSAMMFQGPWNIILWKQEKPNYNLGLNLPAQKDPKNIRPLSYGPGGSNSWVYYSKSKAAPVIGDIFSYWAGANGQLMWAERDGAADPAFDPAALRHAQLDPLSEKAVKLGRKYNVIRPEPAVRNPDVTQVYLSWVPPTPSFSDRMVGLYTKQIKKSVKQVLKDANDAAEKALDDAIRKAKGKGAKVSRDDWVFSDWDPTKPYSKLYGK